ncbi:MAG: RNase H-like domain-containing protein [Kangiellaceae bacterium]|nr:RNase H-like domain-containing protein [Kangiellaceae bacterium]
MSFDTPPKTKTMSCENKEVSLTETQQGIFVAMEGSLTRSLPDVLRRMAPGSTTHGSAESRRRRELANNVGGTDVNLLPAKMKAVALEMKQETQTLQKQMFQTRCKHDQLIASHTRSAALSDPMRQAREIFQSDLVKAQVVDDKLAVKQCNAIREFEFVQPHFEKGLCYSSPPIAFKLGQEWQMGFLDSATREVKPAEPPIVSCESVDNYLLPNGNTVTSANNNFTEFQQVEPNGLMSKMTSVSDRKQALEAFVGQPAKTMNTEASKVPFTAARVFRLLSKNRDFLKGLLQLPKDVKKGDWQNLPDMAKAGYKLWKESVFSNERILNNYREQMIVGACALVSLFLLLFVAMLVCRCGRRCAWLSAHRVMIIRSSESANRPRSPAKRRRQQAAAGAEQSGAVALHMLPLSTAARSNNNPPGWPSTSNNPLPPFKTLSHCYANVINNSSTRMTIQLRTPTEEKFNCLLDTGACINCISSRLVKKLNLPMERTRLQMVCANGQMETLTRRTVIRIKVHGEEKELRAFLLPQMPFEYDLLMGNAGLESIGLEYAINPVSKIVRFGEESYPIVCSIRVVSDNMARLVDDVTIPPMTMACVKVAADSQDGQEPTRVLIPRESMADKYGLYVATALVQVSRDQTFRMQVTNPHMGPVKLRRNMVLGSLHLEEEFQPVTVNTAHVQNGNEQQVRQWVDEQLQIGDSDLSKDQLEQLKELIISNRDVFALCDQDMGLTTKFSANIKLQPHAAPLAARPYNMAYNLRSRFDEIINSLVKRGVLQPSDSEYASPCLLVEKKTRDEQGRPQLRLVVDYRRLNELVISPAIRPPKIMDILGRLNKAKLFTTVDLKDGFYQLKLDPDSFKYTAFVTPDGLLYEFTRVPMGIKCAPSLMCRLIAMLTAESKSRIAYIDDILVMAANFMDMIRELEALFAKLREHGLRITLRKCAFARKEVEYLGFVVSAQGIKPAPKLVEKIQQFPIPKTLKELQRFLGMANFYRVHIAGYSQTAAPLLSVVKHANKTRKFEWNPQADEAFRALKEFLTKGIILVHPDANKQYILHTDASDVAIGATLSQEDDRKKLRPVAYISKTLTPTEQRYSTIERETLAIHWAVKKLHVFLYATTTPFVVYTDHQPLKALLTEKQPESRRLLKWVLNLQDYNFIIQYIRGKANAVADCLSRLPQVSLLHPIPHTKELKEAFERDPVLTPIRDILQGKEASPELSKRQRRFVTRNLHNFFIRDEILFHEDKKGQVQVVLPLSHREAVLQMMHDAPLAGHLGIQKTIDRISKFYYWPGMIPEIKSYVNQCAICNRAKSGPRMQTEAKAVRQVEIFDTLAIDLVGPLPVTPQLDRDFKYILTAQCCLSKFLFTIPLDQTSSKVICETLFKHVFAVAGLPRRILSDNGPQFTSQEFRKYMEMLGVQITYTSVYTPSSNPVERAHRTMKQTLTAFVNDRPQLWYDYLPAVTLAMNTAVHAATKESPFYLFFGRDFLPPSEKVLQNQVLGIMEKPETFNILSSAIVLAREVARHYVNAAADKRAEDANTKTRSQPLKVGDRCFLDVTPTRGHKFANPFKGPFRIIRILSPQNAVIVDVNKPFDAPTVVRTSRLKPQPPLQQGDGTAAVPKFTAATTQTHTDHTLPPPKSAGTQTSEDRGQQKEERKKGRPKRSEQAATDQVGHKYNLRSKADM